MRGPFRRRPLMPGPRRRWPGVFRPGLRPPLPPIVGEARAQLAKANRLLAEGRSLEAAQIFAQVAALADQQGAGGRAAQLSARACQSYLAGGDLASARTHALRAARFALQSGDLTHAVRLAHRLLAEFRERGSAAEADALKNEINREFSKAGISLSDAAPGESDIPARKLPAQCPACLGPVRPDEVDWVDESSARCSYCGTILSAE